MPEFDNGPAGPGRLSRRRFLKAGAAAAVATGTGLTARHLFLHDSPRSEVWVHDFGAVGDGCAEDGPAVQAALSEAARRPHTRVRFRSGTYRLGRPPRGSYALNVVEAKHLVLDGPGATLLVNHPDLGCLRFDRCQRCEVRGLAIDYDPLPHASGIVIEVGHNGQMISVQFSDRMPTPDDAFDTLARPGEEHPTSFGVVFDAASRQLKPSTPDHLIVEVAERVRGNLFRLGIRPYPAPAQLSVDDLLVYPIRRYGNALSFFDTPGAVVDKVRILAANASAIALIRSEHGHIRDTTTSAGWHGERLFSTNGDGVHAQDCRVGPVVERCHFEGMLDDGLNVYGQPLVVTEVPGESDLVLRGRGDLREGDVIQVFDPVNGRDRGSRRIIRARVDDARRNWQVRLDRPMSGVRPGRSSRVADTAFNLSASGEGVTVRNTTYKRHRGISVRIRASGSTVEKNVFTESGSASIDLTNNPDWPEGPVPARVVVSGNRIERPNAVTGEVAIDIGTRVLAKPEDGALLAQQVRVEENLVRDWRGTAVRIANAQDVSLRNNHMQASETERTTGPALHIEGASKISVEGLAVSGKVPVAVDVGPDVEGGAQLSVSGLYLPPGTTGVRRRS